MLGEEAWCAAVIPIHLSAAEAGALWAPEVLPHQPGQTLS